MFAARAPLSEDIGEKLAHWATGRKDSPGDVSTNDTYPEIAAVPQPPPTPPDQPAGVLVAPAGPTAGFDDYVAWDIKLASAATCGTTYLRTVCETVPDHMKPTLKAALENRHWPAAKAVDAMLEKTNG